jgi:hypothetical protein
MNMYFYIFLSLYFSYISTNRVNPRGFNNFQLGDNLSNIPDIFSNMSNMSPDDLSINAPASTPPIPLPSINTTPVNASSQDLLGLEDANDAINSALQTLQNTNIAVQAAVNAIATCSAEGVVDCEQLKKLYNKTQEYINIASTSYQKASNSASNTIKISNKAKGLLTSFSLGKNKANAKFSDLAAQIAQNAVSQAKIAASAVAQATAQCSVIVKIRCNECPTPTLSGSAPADNGPSGTTVNETLIIDS